MSGFILAAVQSLETQDKAVHDGDKALFKILWLCLPV